MSLTHHNVAVAAAAAAAVIAAVARWVRGRGRRRGRADSGAWAKRRPVAAHDGAAVLCCACRRAELRLVN